MVERTLLMEQQEKCHERDTEEEKWQGSQGTKRAEWMRSNNRANILCRGDREPRKGPKVKRVQNRAAKLEHKAL